MSSHSKADTITYEKPTILPLLRINPITESRDFMSTSITSCVGDVTLDPKRHVSLGGGNPIVYLWVNQRGQLPGQQSG